MHGKTATLLLAALVLPASLPAAAATPAATAPSTTSTLATAGQLRFERQVLAVLASPDMQAEMARTRALYAADPQGKTATGQATIGRAVQAMATAAAQYAVGELDDEDGARWVVNAPHEWLGLAIPRSGYGIDNPDNVYRNIFLDGDGRYRIEGQITPPGPAEEHFDLRDAIPGTKALTREGGKSLPSLRSDQLVIAPDGRFAITADSSPAGGRPNHLQLPGEGRVLVIVRDLFTEWGKQNPVSLRVERLDRSENHEASHERVSSARMAARAAALLSRMAPFWLTYDNRYIFAKPANDIAPVRKRSEGRGLVASGHFLLGEGEAFVLTLAPLGAKSLGVELTDPWGVAYRYEDRTGSLNLTQARPNRDGSYTFVVAQSDPGVANWLDPEGHDAGIIAVRWQSTPVSVDLESAILQHKTVPLAELKDVLPPETTFLSPAEREVQQEKRLASYLHRLGE